LAHASLAARARSLATSAAGGDGAQRAAELVEELARSGRVAGGQAVS